MTRFSAPSSGITYATSGSAGSSAIGKPKPLGSPLPSRRSQRLARVVGAVDAAVVLLPEPLRPGRVEEELVHALADFGVRVGQEVGCDAGVDRRPASRRRRRSGTSRRPRSRRTSAAASRGSIWIEWQHMPPAPGFQRSRVACSTSPVDGRQLRPSRRSGRARPARRRGRASPARRRARLDVPESRRARARQLDLLGPLPALAAVRRALDRAAVDRSCSTAA